MGKIQLVSIGEGAFERIKQAEGLQNYNNDERENLVATKNFPIAETKGLTLSHRFREVMARISYSGNCVYRHMRTGGSIRQKACGTPLMLLVEYDDMAHILALLSITDQYF